jgi:hypothetical protein
MKRASGCARAFRGEELLRERRDRPPRETARTPAGRRPNHVGQHPTRPLESFDTRTGNRILLADVPLGFWVRRDKYLFDAAKPGFTEVPQPLYFVGKGFVPEQPMTLLVSRGGDSPVTEVAAGTPVVVLAYSPAPGAAGADDSQGCTVALLARAEIGATRKEPLRYSNRSSRSVQGLGARPGRLTSFRIADGPMHARGGQRSLRPTPLFPTSPLTSLPRISRLSP